MIGVDDALAIGGAGYLLTRKGETVTRHGVVVPADSLDPWEIIRAEVAERNKREGVETTIFTNYRLVGDFIYPPVTEQDSDTIKGMVDGIVAGSRKGIAHNIPQIVDYYDSGGKRIRKNFTGRGIDVRNAIYSLAEDDNAISFLAGTTGEIVTTEGGIPANWGQMREDVMNNVYDIPDEAFADAMSMLRHSPEVTNYPVSDNSNTNEGQAGLNTTELARRAHAQIRQGNRLIAKYPEAFAASGVFQIAAGGVLAGGAVPALMTFGITALALYYLWEKHPGLRRALKKFYNGSKQFIRDLSEVVELLKGIQDIASPAGWVL